MVSTKESQKKSKSSKITEAVVVHEEDVPEVSKFKMSDLDRTLFETIKKIKERIDDLSEEDDYDNIQNEYHSITEAQSELRELSTIAMNVGLKSYCKYASLMENKNNSEPVSKTKKKYESDSETDDKESDTETETEIDDTSSESSVESEPPKKTSKTTKKDKGVEKKSPKAKPKAKAKANTKSITKGDEKDKGKIKETKLTSKSKSKSKTKIADSSDSSDSE